MIFVYDLTKYHCKPLALYTTPMSIITSFKVTTNTLSLDESHPQKSTYDSYKDNGKKKTLVSYTTHLSMNSMHYKLNYMTLFK